MTVFTLLWGYPFLVRGQGVSDGTAGALLVVMTATQILLGPVVGGVVARHPFQRSRIVLTVVAAIAAVFDPRDLWARLAAVESRRHAQRHVHDPHRAGVTS
jgi:cyanate permease